MTSNPKKNSDYEANSNNLKQKTKVSQSASRNSLKRQT